MPSLDSNQLKDSFSSLFVDEKLGLHCQEILSSIGLEALDHYPEEALVALLEVIGKAVEIIPAEQDLWKTRREAVQVMLDHGARLQRSGFNLPRLSRERNIQGNIYGGLFALHPLPASFVQDHERETKQLILPFQALLLRQALEQARGKEFSKGGLRIFADSLRHASSRAHPLSRLLYAIAEEQLLEGFTPAEAKNWASSLLDVLPKLQNRYQGHQSETDFLRQVESAAKNLPIEPSLPSQVPRATASVKDQRTRTYLRRPDASDDIPVRRAETKVPPAPRASRIPAPPQLDEDPSSPNHEERTVGETEAVTSDQTPANVARERLQLRYSGYNTALDNQYLPFTWDSLSSVEISCLSHHLLSDLDSQDNQLFEQAWWAGVILATGQTFDLIEAMARPQPGEIEDQIGSEGVWRRTLRLPKEAFKPRVDQRKHLIETDQCFELPLPQPLQKLAEAMLSKHRISSSAEPGRIERLVREYCQHLRDSTKMRFLPGRLAAALKPKVMALTGDPVVVHLLASRPTDLPPSGVFYTTYQPDQLVRIYLSATATLLPGPV